MKILFSYSNLLILFFGFCFSRKHFIGFEAPKSHLTAASTGPSELELSLDFTVLPLLLLFDHHSRSFFKST